MAGVVVCMTLLLTALCVAGGALSWPPPPVWTEKAKMARYLVHYADWGVVSGVSPEYQLMPFGTIQSFADGPISNSTGVAYFYISSLSDTYNNIHYNSSVSMTLSLDQSLYCRQKGIDTEDPTCSRVTLFGQMEVVEAAGEEAFARKSLFARHPAMESWPTSHAWHFYKLHLTGVCLLDYYGGATHVPLPDYYSAVP